MDELRFLKKQNLENSITVMETYVSDFIRHYGIDVTYFRKFNSFYDETVNADVVHGEEPTAEYTISENMVCFSEILADSYLLNKFGIQNNMEIEVSISIRDFIEQFRDYLGTDMSLDASVDVSGYLVDGIISGVVNTDEIYAEVATVINESTDLSAVTFDVTKKHRPKDLLFHASLDYDYGTEEIIASLSGELTNVSGTVTGSVTGSVPYKTNYASNQKTNITMRPQVGDFFRLVDYGLQDEYEITEVHTRQLTGSGSMGSLNPMYNRYLYKCTAIRRMASHETVIDAETVQEEPFTADKLESIDWMEEEVSGIVSGIADADNISDNVYGL